MAVLLVGNKPIRSTKYQVEGPWSNAYLVPQGGECAEKKVWYCQAYTVLYRYEVSPCEVPPDGCIFRAGCIGVLSDQSAEVLFHVR